jgi:hypothetical protein
MSIRIRDLQVELVPVSALTAYAGNAHTHSKIQLRQIAESITVFGRANPMLADARGVVIAGHRRLEGAKLLGIWDPRLLALELRGLLEMEPDFFEMGCLRPFGEPKNA